MKKDALVFAGLAVAVFLGHHFGAKDALLFFGFLALGTCAFFYLVVTETRVAVVFASAVIAVVLLGKGWRLGPVYCLFFAGGFLAMVTGLVYVIQEWNGRLRDSRSRHVQSGEALRILEQKYEDKKTSLASLQAGVNEIIHLFELARELNECLSYEKLVDTLRERVFLGLAFQSSFLLVFADETVPPSVIRSFTLAAERGEGEQVTEDLSPFQKKLVQECWQRREPWLVQSQEVRPGWMEGQEAAFPFWLFPLVVQARVIALFVVEGGEEKDRPKFQVITSQLALQVQKIKLYETVRELSIVDGLTRVFVRRHFLERFEEELKRSIRHGFHVSVLILDIDHFKSYNDNYGHLVGDITLREVSQVIREGVRRVDIVSRYGGEEFVVALPETDKQGGVEVAERIRSAVARKRFKVYDEETQVTVSIGVASFPADLKERDATSYRADLIIDLLKLADQALYRAKEEGRNRVVLC